MSRSRLCFVVESGTDVRLVEGFAERFALTMLARRIKGGVEVSQPPALSVDVTVGPASRVRFAQQVRRHLGGRNAAFDAVIVQGYGPAALAANLAARRSGTRTFMLVCSPVEAYYRCRRHDPRSRGTFHRTSLAGLQIFARVNARLGQSYIVLSEHLEQVVRAHGTHLPIHVIPVYGVDMTIFRPATTPRVELRKTRDLPLTGEIIFFSSRVAPEKDAATLLRAVRNLRGNGRDLWLLHRSGGFRQFLAVAEEIGVADRVIATDAVHPERELPLDYQASDLCVQASREEGLGFSPLEAMACGIPVVAAAVGGLLETVRDGDTGWTYPVGDIPALTDRIASALDDRTEASRRAGNARRMVRERYQRRDVFDRLAALIGRGEPSRVQPTTVSA